MTSLLAHQGGWDELILVVAPIVVIAVLILRSRHRDREEGEEPGEDRRDGPPETGS